MKHVMLDLETMSTASNAAIVAIGAVEFDPATGNLGKEFYCNVDLASCQDAGLDVEAGTVMWWLRRSEEAREALTFNPHALGEALSWFTQFLVPLGAPDVAVWGKGSDFDNVILGNAYRALGHRAPWKYKNNRCVRTILAMVPDACDEVSTEGTKHNALDDAIYQVKCISVAWQKLGLSK